MNLDIFKPKDAKSYNSIANYVTLLRLITSLIFFILAAIKMSPTLNFIGFGIHWIVDFLDGLLARKLKQETILGAEMDIIADRVEIMFFYVNFLFFNPTLYLPIALYIIDYAFIDFYLSYQFIKYDIISPNYFYKVNRMVYLLNYSPGGKFANSSLVVLMLIFLPKLYLFVAVIALVLIGVKSYSVYLLRRMDHQNR